MISVSTSGLQDRILRTGGVGSINSPVVIPKGAARNMRSLYFDLREVGRKHAYLRTAISSIGRSIVGPGFELVKHPLYGDEAKESEKVRLWDFYTNIKLVESGVRELDVLHPLPNRIYKLVGAYRLFGIAAWELRWNKAKTKILGSVPIDGYLHPNTDERGVFKEDAWYQYFSRDGKPQILSFDDVVAFMWPDFSAPGYATDVESLVEYTLSSDIYMLLSIRELFKNMRAPFGIWNIDPSVDDDTFDAFEATIDSIYKGAINYGRSALAARGEISYTPVAQNINEIPWTEGHKMSRNETFAVTGTQPQKLGLEDVQGTALAELRREYWEQTSLPITRMLAETMWQEIHVRRFGIRGWVPKFNPPDFTTALQDASIEMRRIQWGQWSPNDALKSRGEEPRPNGDYYLIPQNMWMQNPDGTIYSGEEVDPLDDKPENEETPQDEVPPKDEPERGDRAKALLEFENYLLNEVKRGKRRQRVFTSDIINPELVEVANIAFDEYGMTRETVYAIIDVIREELEHVRR